LSVNQVIVTSEQEVLVSTECNQVYRMSTASGKVQSVYQSNNKEDFRCIALGKRQNYLYGVTKNLKMYVFEFASGKIVNVSSEIASKDVIGVATHPHRGGHLSVWGFDNAVGLFRP